MEQPSSQKIKEGLNVELVFRCKARGNSKLTHQWYKDGQMLQRGLESTLVLNSVTLLDFGWYKCVASCKDSSSLSLESSLAELEVTPREGRSMSLSLVNSRSLSLRACNCPYSCRGVFTDRSIFSLNLSRIQIPTGTSVANCNLKHGLILTYSSEAALFYPHRSVLM